MITKWELGTVYCDLMYSVPIIQHEGCLNDFVLTSTSSKHIPVLLLETRPEEVGFVQLGQIVQGAHNVFHVKSCVTKLRWLLSWLQATEHFYQAKVGIA